MINEGMFNMEDFLDKKIKKIFKENKSIEDIGTKLILLGRELHKKEVEKIIDDDFEDEWWDENIWEEDLDANDVVAVWKKELKSRLFVGGEEE